MANPVTPEMLAALLLGELDQAQEQAVRAALQADPALRQRRDAMELHLRAVRAARPPQPSATALENLFAAARRAQPVAPVHSLASWRGVLVRAAAAVVIAAGVLVGLSNMPVGPGLPTGRVADGAWAHDGELLEAGLGSPRRVSFRGGELLLDGSAAVRMHRTGEFTPPVLELERGRAVVTAQGAPVQVKAGDRTATLDAGSSLAVDWDRPYERVSEGGAHVEVQRLAISQVAELGRRVYSLNINDADLPEEVRRRRISFYGDAMTRDSFVAAFVQAAGRFGVSEEATTSAVKLVYRGAADRGEGEDESLLRLAVVSGGAVVAGGTAPTRLERRAGAASELVLGSAREPSAQPQTDAALGRMLVWARGRGSEGLDRVLADVDALSQGLPAGSVIHSDRLVLPKGEERVFMLGSAEFSYPLPDGRRGRLVGLLSSGAEFEVRGDARRVFLPFGRATQ